MANEGEPGRAAIIGTLGPALVALWLAACGDGGGTDGGAGGSTAGGAQGGAGAGGATGGTAGAAGGAAGATGGAAGATAGAAGAAGSGGAGAAGGSAGGAGAAGAGCPPSVAPSPGVVVTERGAVKGALTGGVYSYKNIPFAAPPVGTLRWKPPQPAACWDGVRDATQWGNVCPQFEGAKVVGDEDCLTLNVWAAEEVAASPRPVLVWIHGGGHIQGGAAEVVAGQHLYDAQALAKRTGAIVVTINYRLGPLGYLAHPALTAEAGPKGSGNYAALDQIAALRWVKANAASFGGDPSRVTIFGESAGGVSVCTLVASPLAAGLFSAAIVQSGACNARPLAEGEAFGGEVFEAAKCSSQADPVACMRGLSMQAVLTAKPVQVDVAGKVSIYGSFVDGYVLPDVPSSIIAAGKHNHVPIIVGNTSDETSRTVPDGIDSEAAYAAAVAKLFPAPGLAEKILQQYPPSSYPSPRTAYVAVTTDAKFVCTSRRVLKALSTSQSEPAYRFIVSLGIENAPKLKGLGAWHGIDVIYLFGTLYSLPGYTPTASMQAVTDAMQSHWGRMAETGDPNGNGLPAWPAWSTAADPYLEFGSTITASQGFRTERCDFWDGLLPP